MINILFISSQLHLSRAAKAFGKKILLNFNCKACLLAQDPAEKNYLSSTYTTTNSSDEIPSIDSIDLCKIDIAITLDKVAKEKCKFVLPGQPTLINWQAEKEDDDGTGSHNEKLANYIESLITGNYIDTMQQNKKSLTLLLDSISEGVIVHDINRKIYLFNNAAEKITGYSKDEVTGKDCHDIFPNNFCGDKCSFCDKHKTPGLGDLKYPAKYISKSGTEKDLEMSVRVIGDDKNEIKGVITSFRDLSYKFEYNTSQATSFSGIIGIDNKMRQIFKLIASVAKTTAPVLVCGASGTGKELVATAIHNESTRKKMPLVTVNCGAIPDNLLESELFGHVKGSFTGAIKDKKGRFELADGGTIFLDEIGDITQAMQVKLLRVLQEGTFERVGSEKTSKIDVRVVSATNKDLKEEIAKGNFREDLFYRLNVVPIFLPSLSERQNDIPLLIDHFLKKTMNETEEEKNIKLSPEVLDLMLHYEWPGNIRELQNWIQYSLIKSTSDTIELSDLPDFDRKNLSMKKIKLKKEKRGKLDAEKVSKALHEAKGNKLKAAKLLGVGRATLYRFLDKDNN